MHTAEGDVIRESRNKDLRALEGWETNGFRWKGNQTGLSTQITHYMF